MAEEARQLVMSDLVGEERAAYVRSMFSRVARRYDRLNRLLSLGQDVKWRRQVIDLAHLPPRAKLLDIGTGTGDLASEALRRDGSLLAVGADFTVEMMRQGQARRGLGRIQWVNSDALELPFPAASFDAVTSGYLLRNVIDVRRALAEQYRVLKPGGRAVCLDTTPPPPDGWHGPVRFYVRAVVPVMGRLIAREAEAYTYLPESTARFLKAEELADCMRQAGFQGVQFRRLMFGTMAIHWGYR